METGASGFATRPTGPEPGGAAAPPAAETAVAQKVFRRLGWFLVLLFIASYLDRINLGFAALSMNRDLQLSATTYGLATTVFYTAYIAAEVPSNLLMARYGARIWIPRIMISWGFASAATILAEGPSSLLALRGLVGLAEAGFMPSILLYITFWFPPAYRARATSLFILAQPITILFGAPLSGLLLGLDGVAGLAGWRWLLLAEGLPAIILGIVAYFYLSNQPRDAAWLTSEEKRHLQAALDRSDAPTQSMAASAPRRFAWLTPQIGLLSVAYIGLVVSLGANSTWTPQIVREMLPGQSLTVLTLFFAMPALVTILVMPAWGRHSDRTMERTWHIALPMVAAAVGWACVALGPWLLLRYAGLVLATVGTFSAQGIFWTLPAAYLPPAARPVGIAMVNTIGMLGVALGPLVIGSLRDATDSFAPGLAFVAASLALGAACIALAQREGREPAPSWSRHRRGAA